MDIVFTGDYAASKALMTVIASCGAIGTICFIQAMRYYNLDAE